jgi:hypothetical protein
MYDREVLYQSRFINYANSSGDVNSVDFKRQNYNISRIINSAVNTYKPNSLQSYNAPSKRQISVAELQTFHSNRRWNDLERELLGSWASD